MRIITSWEEEGLERGLKQGRQQEAALLIMRMLRRRFGELAPGMEAQLNALPVAILEDLSDALLDFSTADEVEDWLESRAQEPVAQVS